MLLDQTTSVLECHLQTLVSPFTSVVPAVCNRLPFKPQGQKYGTAAVKESQLCLGNLAQ